MVLLVKQHNPPAAGWLATRVGMLATEPGGIAVWTVSSFRATEPLARSFTGSKKLQKLQPVVAVSSGTYHDFGREILQRNCGRRVRMHMQRSNATPCGETLTNADQFIENQPWHVNTCRPQHIILPLQGYAHPGVRASRARVRPPPRRPSPPAALLWLRWGGRWLAGAAAAVERKAMGDVGQCAKKKEAHFTNYRAAFT
jgi:hypothetical protein